MLTRKHRGAWAAGAFVQAPDGGVSSLTGLNVSSAAVIAGLTINSLTGAAGYRGISILTSGTTVVSVAATAAVSGAVIMLQPIQYVNAPTGVASAAQFFVGVIPTSVRAGAFEITAIGSRAPIADVPVGWFVIR